MTRIEIFTAGKDIVGFAAAGHSGFAQYGEDIVCAAVSVLTQTAVIGLQEVLGAGAAVEISEGLLKCTLPPGLPEAVWQQSQLILKVMYAGLKAVFQEYGAEYLEIEEVEQ
ncbi:MAG TPA: ribosomal-processing cysteine protease Prp [Limnochordia bacterium]|nr:ribosomal-processing cysteine protease Prp [Bacillota bacterium]HKM17989.1 ribosomal-processing cysteine protease Prp [Limnochordia bacterium]